MSNNTNNLFLVIVGAVIVFAVFMIIKINNDNTVKDITDRFDSYFRPIARMKPNYPLTKDNWRVDITRVSFHQTSNTTWISYSYHNLSDITKTVTSVSVSFFNCDTKQRITGLSQTMSYIVAANQTRTDTFVFAFPPERRAEFDCFYIDFTIRD